jgi:hypothetical protein
MAKRIKSVAIYTSSGVPFYEVGKNLMKPDPEDSQKRIESEIKVTDIKVNLRKKRVEVFFQNGEIKENESTIFDGFPLSVGYTT